MIPPAVKENLRRKYNNQCAKCKTTQDLSVDHILPKWLGGTDHFDNLQILCRTCNWRKGYLPTWWVRVKHVFSGFFYRVYHEVKQETTDKITNLTEEQRKLAQSCQDSLKALYNKIELEIKPLTSKINVLEFEIKTLKGENIQLRERIKGMEDYEKVHWVEEIIKEYRKND